MRPRYATPVQLLLALTVIITCAFIPTKWGSIIYHNRQWLIIGACITGILFIQVLKMLYEVEKKLKAKIKEQAQLLNSALLTNSFNARLLRDFVIPGLIEHNPDESISRLNDCGISINDLKNYGINPEIIASYELFYYIRKAKEQQDLLNAAKKTNGDMVNTPIIKELTSETDNTYTLRPVSSRS